MCKGLVMGAMGRVNDHGPTSTSAIGLTLMGGLKRTVLKQQMRASEDEAHMKHLARMRDTKLAQPVSDELIASIKQLSEADCIADSTWITKAPTVVLSHIEQHALGRLRMMEFAKAHGRVLVRWPLAVVARQAAAMDVSELAELREHEEGMWVYFVVGAPCMIVDNINPAMGAANGTRATFHSLSFAEGRAPDELADAERRGGYHEVVLDAPPLTINYELELDDTARAHWPPEQTLVPGRVVLPAYKSSNALEHMCASVFAAQRGLGILLLEQHCVANGFVPTDFKEQGRTEEKLIASASKKPFRPHLSLPSWYMMVSRVRRSSDLRSLSKLNPEDFRSLRWSNELAAWDQSYDSDGFFQPELARAAMQRVQALSARQRKSANAARANEWKGRGKDTAAWRCRPSSSKRPAAKPSQAKRQQAAETQPAISKRVRPTNQGQKRKQPAVLKFKLKDSCGRDVGSTLPIPSPAPRGSNTVASKRRRLRLAQIARCQAATPMLLQSGQVMKQPGDGSCLFHSLLYGLLQLPARFRTLQSSRTVSEGSCDELRRGLADWVALNSTMEVEGMQISTWIDAEKKESVVDYVDRMRKPNEWGGSIEMTACSRLLGVNVWVYQRAGRRGFRRTHAFDAIGASEQTVHVLYNGRTHYDALVPDEAEIVAARARLGRPSTPQLEEVPGSTQQLPEFAEDDGCLRGGAEPSSGEVGPPVGHNAAGRRRRRRRRRRSLLAKGLRFAIGARVECLIMDRWSAGTVVKLFYLHKPSLMYMPYTVRLDSGRIIRVLKDDDKLCRAEAPVALRGHAVREQAEATQRLHAVMHANDMLTHVLSHLGDRDLLSALCVSREWQEYAERDEGDDPYGLTERAADIRLECAIRKNAPKLISDGLPDAMKDQLREYWAMGAPEYEADDTDDSESEIEYDGYPESDWLSCELCFGLVRTKDGHKCSDDSWGCTCEACQCCTTWFLDGDLSRDMGLCQDCDESA